MRGILYSIGLVLSLTLTVLITGNLTVMNIFVNTLAFTSVSLIMFIARNLKETKEAHRYKINAKITRKGDVDND